MSPDCRYLQTSISLEIGQEKFICTGKTLISPGFTQFMPWLKITTEENMPAFKRDDVYSVQEVMNSNLIRLLLNLISVRAGSVTQVSRC